MNCLCYFQISVILFTAVLTVPATVIRNENSQFMSKDDLKRVQKALVYETMNRRSEQILYPNMRPRMTFDDVPFEKKDFAGFELERGNAEATFGPFKLSKMKRENEQVPALELSENVHEYENRLALPKVEFSSAKNTAPFYKFINRIFSPSLDGVTGAIKRNQNQTVPPECSSSSASFAVIRKMCILG